MYACPCYLREQRASPSRKTAVDHALLQRIQHTGPSQKTEACCRAARRALQRTGAEPLCLTTDPPPASSVRPPRDSPYRQPMPSADESRESAIAATPRLRSWQSASDPPDVARSIDEIGIRRDRERLAAFLRRNLLTLS